MITKRKSTSNRGERVNTAKLTADEVVAIRALRKSGKTLKSISDIYDVSEAAISHVCANPPKSWKHV